MRVIRVVVEKLGLCQLGNHEGTSDTRWPLLGGLRRSVEYEQAHRPGPRFRSVENYGPLLVLGYILAPNM